MSWRVARFTRPAVVRYAGTTFYLSRDGPSDMASPVMEKLRAEILSLPDKDRAELALQLMASLDGAPESDAEQAWDAEILRRVAEIDAGTAKLIDRGEFSRRLRERIGRG